MTGELIVAPYDHSRGDPQMTGMRGRMLDATTNFPSGAVFSTDFPTVWLSDNGEVAIADYLRTTLDDAAGWFRAVADYLDQAQRSVIIHIDTSSSASRQHHIDTGEYLRSGESL